MSNEVMGKCARTSFRACVSFGGFYGRDAFRGSSSHAATSANENSIRCISDRCQVNGRLVSVFSYDLSNPLIVGDTVRIWT